MFFSNFYLFPLITKVGYIIFLSALILAIRTDLEGMVIPQIISIYLAPLGIALAYFEYSFVTLTDSLVGAVIGFGFLWLIAFLFRLRTGKDGLGVGDMELAALIGSFLGLVGVWQTIMKIGRAHV